LLFRREQSQQRVGCLVPGNQVNLPDVHFVIRQDAIAVPQGLGVHRLKYHGQREAANLRF
jgi:hypothetical protein